MSKIYEVTGAHARRDKEDIDRVLMVKADTREQMLSVVEGTGATFIRDFDWDVGGNEVDYNLTGEHYARTAATTIEEVTKELREHLQWFAAHPPGEDNETFVQRIMTSGSPLRQAFILTAIEKYAEACAAEPAATFDSGFMNGAAWVQVAVEIKAELDKRAAA